MVWKLRRACVPSGRSSVGLSGISGVTHDTGLHVESASDARRAVSGILANPRLRISVSLCGDADGVSTMNMTSLNFDMTCNDQSTTG